MPNNKKNPKSRIPSIGETNAELEKEFAPQDSKAEDLPPKEGDSNVLEISTQSSSSVAEQAGEILSDGTAIWSDGRPLLEKRNLFPCGQSRNR